MFEKTKKHFSLIKLKLRALWREGRRGLDFGCRWEWPQKG
jgi:hypothetical protein